MRCQDLLFLCLWFSCTVEDSRLYMRMTSWRRGFVGAMVVWAIHKDQGGFNGVEAL